MDFPITFQCNSNCISCIYDTRQIKYKKSSPIHQQKDLIKQYDWDDIIGITGGEPTLNKDLFEIIDFARNEFPEKEIFLVTNGRAFVSQDFVKRMAYLKLKRFKLGIPIYSHDPKIHDKITRVKGSWNETVKGIENLLENDFLVEIRVIVEKMNYRDLKKTAEFITEHFKGVGRVVFINIKYTGNAFLHRDKVFVRYTEAVPFVQKAADVLVKKGIETRLFHFPLCTIDRKYWHMATGITKSKRELTYLKQCLYCDVQEECPMIWKTYVVLAGTREFKPVRLSIKTNPQK